MPISMAGNVATPASSFRERRRGESEWNFATATVAHAINYLLTEQLAGRRHPLAANREAVTLLCRVFEELAATERRAPERKSLLSRLLRFRNERGMQ